MQSLFTDGVANITILDQVVRMDLAQLKPNHNLSATPNTNPEFTVETSLCMSVPALLRTYDLMQKAINEMTSQGLLKKVEPNSDEPSKSTKK